MDRFLKSIEEASVDSLDRTWDSLYLRPKLSEAINKAFQFQRMTPVQAATIPLMLKNKDLIVEAKTGSGKTLAFLVPVVELLLRMDELKPIESHDVLAIILSPTRELAAQIHHELRKLLKNLPLGANGGLQERKFVNLLITGGNSSVASDISKYERFGANLIVATPGRLSAILEGKDNRLSACIRKRLSFLIFDEADQLLSFGFEHNLSSILAYLPKQRRTSLFSATQTREVEELIKSGLRDPVRVNINQLDCPGVGTDDSLDDFNKPLSMPSKLDNYYLTCDSYAHKLATVCEFIRQDEHKKMLVFVSTCSQIDYFVSCIELWLEKGADKGKKTLLLKLHRRLKTKRKSVFQRFKAVKRCVLFVTDILSRGIDVPDIDCVIHVDLPETPECYVHRSGRSGHRLDLGGKSLLLLEAHEKDYLEMCRRRRIELLPAPMASFKHLVPEINIAAEQLMTHMRLRARADTKFEILGLQAFVSYVRFYTSKLCLRQLLFPKLSVVQLGVSFGLLRLPKMPELRTSYQRLTAEFAAATGEPGAPTSAAPGATVQIRPQ